MYKFRWGYTKENKNKRWQIADYGHPKPENGEKSNWNTAQGKTRKELVKKLSKLSKSLKFIKPLRLSDEVDSSL